MRYDYVSPMRGALLREAMKTPTPRAAPKLLKARGTRSHMTEQEQRDAMQRACWILWLWRRYPMRPIAAGLDMKVSAVRAVIEARAWREAEPAEPPAAVRVAVQAAHAAPGAATPAAA